MGGFSPLSFRAVKITPLGEKPGVDCQILTGEGTRFSKVNYGKKVPSASSRAEGFLILNASSADLESYKRKIDVLSLT